VATINPSASYVVAGRASIVTSSFAKRLSAFFDTTASLSTDPVSRT